MADYTAHYITVLASLDYCTTHITLHIAIALLVATALYGASVCCGSGGCPAHYNVVYGFVRYCNVMYCTTLRFCSSIGGLTSPGLVEHVRYFACPCVYIVFHTYILCM